MRLLLGVCTPFSEALLYFAQIYTSGLTKGSAGKQKWDKPLAEVLKGDAAIASLTLLEKCTHRVLTSSKPNYIEAVIPSPTFLFIKVTFFLMYLQIFWPMRWMRYCAYGGATLLFAFYGGATIVLFVLSTPARDESYQHRLMKFRKPQAHAFLVVLPAVGLAFDVFILILPIIAVTKVQLPLKRRIGLFLIFMTGIL